MTHTIIIIIIIIMCIMLTSWLPLVLLAMSELPKPVNVTLSSSHFIHLLTWEPGPGSPADVYYNVLVHSGSSHAEPVAGCEHVEHPLVCNLTEAFPDPKQDYYTQVTAVLEAQASEAAYVSSGFQPIKDSHLDLPLLVVVPCARDLCVDLQPPVERLRTIYDFFDYNLLVQSSTGQVVFSRDTQSLKTGPLKDLAPGREYCVSVRFSDSMASRVSAYSAPRCATTTAVYTADIQMSVVLCFLLMMPLLCVGLLVWTGFFCRKWQLPLILTSIKHNGGATASLCDGHLSFPVYVESAAPPAGNKGNGKDWETQEEAEDPSGNRGRGYETQYKLGGLRPSACGDSSQLLLPPSDSERPCVHLNPRLPSGEPRPSPVSPGGESRYHRRRADTIETDAVAVEGVAGGEESEGSAAGQDVNFLSVTLGAWHAVEGVAGEESRYHRRRADTIETDAVAVEGVAGGEESEGSAAGQDVNFLSVTLGAWCAVEENRDHGGVPPEEPTSPYNNNNTTRYLPRPTGDVEDVAMETVTTDLAEEELSGYLSRI